MNGLLLQTVEATNPRALVKLKWTGDNNMVRSSSDYGFSQPFEGGNVRSTFSVAVFQELRKANQTLTDVFACFPIGAANVVINDEADLASALGTLGRIFRYWACRQRSAARSQSRTISPAPKPWR